MDSNNQDTSGNPPKRNINWALVLSVVVFIFGGGIIWNIKEYREQNAPPNFSVSAINTLEGENVYEITNHFMEVDPSIGLDGISLEWGVEVVPQYSGNKQYGEVRVLVKDEDGTVLAEEGWSNFSQDSTTLSVPLNPFLLAQSVDKIDLHGGFSDNVFETKTFIFPESTFEIEIVQATNLSTPLHTDKLIIRNSPWFHYSALSSWKNDSHDSIDIYILGKNLGEPSDFAVMGEVYEITEVPGTMWQPWPRLGHQQKVVSVEEGEEFTTNLTFPEGSESDFEFEIGKTYLVHTYLIKRQNYIEFDEWSWDSNGERWRLGSFGNRLLVQP